MLGEGWGTHLQPRKKRGLPLAAAEDKEEPGGGEGCQCQTLIVAVCQTLGQQVKQHIDSLQRMKNRMNSETFTGFQGSLLISKLEFFIKADFRGMGFL